MTSETILQGNDEAKAQGSWVFTDQGVAAEQGFRNVSKQWYPKTISFDDGQKQIAQLASERSDILFNAQDVKFHPAHKTVAVELDGRKFTPTDWGMRQLCNWMGVPQTMWTAYGYGDNGDIELLVRAFENGRRKFEDKKELMFRTYNDGTLRAVMSDSYSIVDNEWYLRTLAEFVPGGRLSHFHFSDADNIFGNILIPDNIREEDDSDYGGMLSISNSEIGRRIISQTPNLFRAICMNGCVWGQIEGVMMKKRHRGIDLSQLKELIRLNIEKQIPLLTTKVDELISTHNRKISASIQSIYAAIAKQHTLNAETINIVAEQWLNESKEKTEFGIIDGLTRGAQKTDSFTWVQLDTIAGSLLNGGETAWSNLNTYAKSLTDKEVAKAFGNAA